MMFFSLAFLALMAMVALDWIQMQPPFFWIHRQYLVTHCPLFITERDVNIQREAGVTVGHERVCLLFVLDVTWKQQLIHYTRDKRGKVDRATKHGSHQMSYDSWLGAVLLLPSSISTKAHCQPARCSCLFMFCFVYD